MAKNYLLKDRDGHPCGYLQQQQQMLRCRITERMAKEEKKDGKNVLILYNNDEETQRFLLGPEEEEQCFSLAGGIISGAIVQRGGQMHLYTDGRTARAFENSLLRESLKRSAERAEKNEKKPEGKLEKTSEKADERWELSHENCFVPRENEWPQRRWPPPACMPRAAYVQGRWIER